MKRFVMTVVLTIALSSIAFAGDIPTDGSPSPAPNPTPTTASAPGQIPTDGQAEFSSEALSALLSVLNFLT